MIDIYLKHSIVEIRRAGPDDTTAHCDALLRKWSTRPQSPYAQGVASTKSLWQTQNESAFLFDEKHIALLLIYSIFVTLFGVY